MQWTLPDLNWGARFRFHQKWLNYTRHMYKSFIALQNEVWRLNNDKWTYAYQIDVKAFKFTRWESTSTIVPFEPLSQESPWRDLATISCSLPMEIERPVSILVYNHPRQDTQAPIQVLKEFTMISFLPELILRWIERGQSLFCHRLIMDRITCIWYLERQKVII